MAEQTQGTVRAAVLDHVAVAVPDLEEPGRWLRSIGASEPGAPIEAPGFSAQQWYFPGGMKLELLRPARTAEDDFVERFLAAHGPGPHHLTFLVDDLHQAIEAVEAAGFPILVARFDNPDWQEAFLHPRDACGTVVQLACSGRARGAVTAPGPADLTAVHLEVGDPERALALFGDVLGGTVGPNDGPPVLSWPGSGSLALHTTDPATLGGRAGRVSRLEVTGLGKGQERISWAPIGTSMGANAVRSTSMR